jgi:hypothetical protein
MPPSQLSVNSCGPWSVGLAFSSSNDRDPRSSSRRLVVRWLKSPGAFCTMFGAFAISPAMVVAVSTVSSGWAWSPQLVPTFCRASFHNFVFAIRSLNSMSARSYLTNFFADLVMECMMSSSRRYPRHRMELNTRQSWTSPSI